MSYAPFLVFDKASQSRWESEAIATRPVRVCTLLDVGGDGGEQTEFPFLAPYGKEAW